MATMAKSMTESVSGALESIKGWPHRVRTFVEGLRLEMRRVTWPNQKQVRATTVVVIITVFVFGFYLGIVDWILGMGMDRLLKLFVP